MTGPFKGLLSHFQLLIFTKKKPHIHNHLYCCSLGDLTRSRHNHKISMVRLAMSELFFQSVCLTLQLLTRTISSIESVCMDGFSERAAAPCIMFSPRLVQTSAAYFCQLAPHAAFSRRRLLELWFHSCLQCHIPLPVPGVLNSCASFIGGMLDGGARADVV